jgi:MFS family permease
MYWSLRDRPALASDDWLDGTLGALGVAGIPVVGALVATRLPGNPYGWLWCAVGLSYAVSGLSPLVRVAGGPPGLAWVLQGWGFVGFLCLLVFVFLLFPTGRLPGRRWRWVGRAAVGVAVVLALLVPFTFDPAAPAVATSWAVRGPAHVYVLRAVVVAVTLLFGVGFVAMTSLIVRFRRADPVERRQLIWFVYAAVLIAVYLVVDDLVVIPRVLGAVLNGASFAVLPVAVGIAIFRYRLFEIDRIVSRTVSYGLLTAGLIALYLLVVALLRPLLEPVTGNSSLAVAASTLVVAAVFNPARKRLQAAVDRRFDRARYDAARAVDGFAARLRDQVDLDEVTTRLRDTVTATVAPTRVAVWLREPARHGEAKS